MIRRPLFALKKRSWLPENFELERWTDIEPYFQELGNTEISSIEELKAWLIRKSELDSFISENLAWRYIRFTRQTDNAHFKAHYEKFINEIQPEIAPWEDKLNRKLAALPWLDEFREEKYGIFFRSVKNDIALFREENIPLFTQISTLANNYAEIQSAMTIEYNGKELTMQQAARYLEEPDRQVRREVYEKMGERRLKDANALDELFAKLVELRHQVALNAGFNSFRDYKFRALGRFDYSIEDNLQLHESIRQEIVPLVKELHERRKTEFGFDELRPYDLTADTKGRPPLKPFKNTSELIEKTIHCFERTGNLGFYLREMQRRKLLDLDTRKGKAPGGYNYPLEETGMPFIFMNASGLLRDVVTLAHEGGHAIHSFLTRDMDLVYFKSTPSEVAELASMSMELIAMEQWNEFFKEESELKRAMMAHLEDVLEVLPWIAIIDKFQHWIYTHPEHAPEQRKTAWMNIYSEFSSGVVDFRGYEAFLENMWQRQLHLFEVPFYYIEYAIAQLGAIAVWRNFKRAPQSALEAYLSALKLGYSQSIPAIYQTAGIQFDFSASYIHELAEFVRQELSKLNS